ncbi:MAG: single-stranded-DNA-specific exonuclease RecJ [Chloroflexi bacterium]|nr:single-stranded-DNA-specific exonuclease RecJ [Chloroflexota bacterium]
MEARRWRVRTAPEALNPVLENHAGTAGRLGAILLHTRGIRDERAAKRFLSPSLDNLSDPFGLPDMPTAVERIAGAVKRGERIGVLGDFDVDGLTGAAILVDTLRGLDARVEVHIPDRAADGHGLTMGTIDSFRAAGVTVVVTADTGSTAPAEISYAASLGIDTVVTDHHLFECRPSAAWAVVNPNQPGTPSDSATLSGSGVAFRLAQALGRAFERNTPRRLVALAALGTIADVAPLTGDNRAITAAGLKELEQTTHPGLRSLMATARNGNRGARGPVDTEMVAFHVGPRLNAPGRLGSPLLSLRLLTTQDQAEAETIAAEIESLNTERQRLSRGAWAIAESQVGRLTELPPLVAVVSSELTPGLLGPLAGRLCSEFGRPSVAVHVEGGIARASARSTPSFDIHAAVAAHASMLHRFGGHARAAGFTCDEKHLDAILSGITKLASVGAGHVATPYVTADAEVALGDLGAGVWTFVQMMAPFGEGNPAPLFFTRGLMPMQVRTLGSGGDHLRLSVDGGARRFDAIGFGLGAANLGSGLVDAIYGLRSDHWNGRSRNELELKAIRPSVAPTEGR